METPSVKKNVLINTIYQILSIIIPLITVPYVSRVLGPEGIGIYSYTHSIVTYFTMFAVLGTMSYGTIEISKKRNDKKTLSKLFWEIEILTCITSSICIILWIIFAYFYHSYTIYMYILTILIINAMLDISWLYAGLEKFKYTITINSIFKVLGVAAIFIFVKDSSDVNKYIFITAVTTLLGTASMWLFLPKFVEKPSFKNMKFKKHIKETMVYFIPTIATSIYTILDKTLIGLITNDLSENGYYEQATKVIEICKAISFYGLNAVLGSRIAFLYTQDKHDEIKKRTDNSINYILLISTGIIFGLIGVADTFSELFFGEEFASAGLYIKLLSPAILLIGISNCIGSHYYTPAGLRKKSAVYIIIGSIVNLFMNLLLIPNFKGIGAILGTLIAETTITTLYIKNCHGLVSLKKLFKFGYKKVASAIIMLIFLILISKIPFNNSILTISTQVIMGCIIYTTSIFLLKDNFFLEMYNTHIKTKIRKILKKES